MPRLIIYSIFNLMAFILAQNVCQNNRLSAVKSGAQKIRGVNLGSWFVLEYWMAQHMWDDNGCKKSDLGSYLLEQCLGNRASNLMQAHWSTWITEEDFDKMSKFGVNAVRIPIGWWQIYDPQGGADNADLNYHVEPNNYVVGALEYIDQALDWGIKYGIGVLIDMHAAPGSQNGDEHSSPSQPGQILWDKYEANVGQTIDSLGLYAERYANHPALIGFCLLNEPARINKTVLQDYYVKSYQRIRRYSKDAWIVISPLISPFEFGTEGHWTSFMNPDQGYDKVAMDLHYYSCFGGTADQSDPDGAINYIKNERLRQIKDFDDTNPKKMLIGEWSACGHFSINRAENFTKAQVEVYNTASLGWTFWSWTDGAPENRWSLQTAINNKWMEPQYPC